MKLVHADGTDITAAAPAAYTEPALGDLDREVTITDGVYQQVTSETGSTYRELVAYPGETLTRRAYLSRSNIAIPSVAAADPTFASLEAGLAAATAVAVTGFALDTIEAVTFQLADGTTVTSTLSAHTAGGFTATAGASSGAGLRGVYASIGGIQLLLWGSIV